MKRTLFLTMALAACFHTVQAATYTNLQESWCDEINNVIYNGRGYFAVQSEANTSLELTLNLNSLYSYVNSNDYSGSSYMLLWENNIQNYGLGDNAQPASLPQRMDILCVECIFEQCDLFHASIIRRYYRQCCAFHYEQQE